MPIINVIKREIEHFIKDPISWVISFILPLGICLIICSIFSAETPKNLPIGVLSEDNSKISRLIIRNINSLTSTKVKYQLTSLKEGKDLLIEGKIYGIIVIPRDFEKDLYSMRQPKLVYYYNNQRILIGGIISKDINLMVQSMLIGLDAKIKSKKGMPFDEAIKQSNLINIVDHIRSNPYFNYLYLISLTAFGHVMQISIAMTSTWAIGSEFKYGKTKEWLKEADNSIIIAVLGKLIPYFLIFSLVFGIIYLIYFGFLNAPYTGNIFMGILVTLCFIIACLSVGVLFMSLNGSARMGLSSCAFCLAIGFAIAGVTYPIMAMPKVIKIYSLCTPLNHWVKVMLNQSIRNTPIVYDIKSFIPLIILTFVMFILMYRLKQLALDEKRWYQL